tara:strand:+ start:47880 stop:48695 length:816 start_codon:yes stop_codon:yes gene_type:complete
MSPDSEKNEASPGVKGRFDELYDREVSGGYAMEMRRLSYRIPDYLDAAQPYYEAFRAENPLQEGARLRMVDLCCGYGANSLIARYGLRDAAVFQWLEQPEPDSLQPSAHRWIESDSEIIGLDIAGNALEFGLAHNLFDHTICRNLETGVLDARETRLVSETDLLISTGSLSYISERTIEALLAAIDPGRPVIGFFWPILGTDTTRIAEAFRRSGFSVTGDPTPLWQRRFKDEAERERFFGQFRSLGIEYGGTLAETGVCASLLIVRRPGQI